MNSEKKKLEEDYFDSSNLYVFLYKYKIQIALIIVLSGLVSSVVSVSIQEKYKSFAKVYPSNTSSVAKALISSKFGGKSDIMEFGEEEKSEHLLEILNSDKVKKVIIQQFNLMKHYGILAEESSTPNYDLNEIYDENISFTRNKNMAVVVTVLDHSPDTAALIVNGLLVALDDVMNNIQKERALQGFEIVKKAYTTLSSEVKDMEDSLSFIMGKGVLDVNSQSEVYGDAYAQAISKGNKTAEKALGAKLDLLSKYGAKNISLRNAIFNESHRLSQLKGKYEEAKIDAESRLENYFTISSPVVAERKSYPVRWLIVVMSVLGALFTGGITIVLYEQFQKLKTQL
jgi:capsule polysaccharide export protein KpsE/RkpR